MSFAYKPSQTQSLASPRKGSQMDSDARQDLSLDRLLRSTASLSGAIQSKVASQNVKTFCRGPSSDRQLAETLDWKYPEDLF